MVNTTDYPANGDIMSNATWTTETKATVYSLGTLTLTATLIGIGLNIISMKAFKLMNTSVIYTYFDLILKGDTVRLLSCGVIALLMQIFTTDSLIASEHGTAPPGMAIFIVNSILFSCSNVTCVLELCINVDRVIVMAFYSNRPRPKTGITQHPKTITAVCAGFAIFMFVARIVGRLVNQPLYDTITTISAILPLVVKVITLGVISVLFVYMLRYTKSQSRLLPAQNGPAYLRHKTMLSSTRSVMIITALSIVLSLGATALPMYYLFTGQTPHVQNDVNRWSEFFIIYIFLECLGCVNFFLYIILIDDFKVALKKLRMKECMLCRKSNQIAPLDQISLVEQ